ncbi:unnamed protein product [Ilex paraguariensis]|uniref:Uncharacterized protein n=1 Tax=Ilex paraguariensis TaxID=185542 RepID=A0ABC8R146_9AQUA
MTQSNVKMLQRHFQADTLPWNKMLRQKEQGLQRRLLRVRQASDENTGGIGRKRLLITIDERRSRIS